MITETSNILAEDDQPQYKVRMNGISNVSNSELISLIIGGEISKSLTNSKALYQNCKYNLKELARMNVSELTKIPGIGQAKALAIVAAIELGRRKQMNDALDRETIQSSKDIAEFLQPRFSDLNHEEFGVIFLNSVMRVLHFEIISKGGITGTIADQRIILKKALEQNAVSIILCHNHPSGRVLPSKEDVEQTAKIKEAAKYFDIKVIDHVIVGSDGYYSFADEGMM